MATVAPKRQFSVAVIVQRVLYDRKVGKLLKGNPDPKKTKLAHSRSAAAILRQTQRLDCNVVKRLGSSRPKVNSFVINDVKQFVNSLEIPAAKWTSSFKQLCEDWTHRVCKFRVDSVISKEVRHFVNSFGCPGTEWNSTSYWRRGS